MHEGAENRTCLSRYSVGAVYLKTASHHTDSFSGEKFGPGKAVYRHKKTEAPSAFFLESTRGFSYNKINYK